MTLQDTQRRARYGHRDWIYWTDRKGDNHALRANRESVKAALLSIGTKGRFLLVSGSTGVTSLHRFSDGCRMMRNAKDLWGRL